MLFLDFLQFLDRFVGGLNVSIDMVSVTVEQGSELNDDSTKVLPSVFVFRFVHSFLGFSQVRFIVSKHNLIYVCVQVFPQTRAEHLVGQIMQLQSFLAWEKLVLEIKAHLVKFHIGDDFEICRLAHFLLYSHVVADIL